MHYEHSCYIRTGITLDDASKKYKYDRRMDATLHVSHQPSREETALLVLRRGAGCPRAGHESKGI